MTDLWSFLVHTLNASTAALFILLIKRIFRDKLTPVWQFSVWIVLLAVLIIPGGTIGGYIFIDWTHITEFLKTYFLDSYTLSEAVSFFPLPIKMSLASIFDALYVIYFAGVIFCLVKYIISYIRLRFVLKKADKLTDTKAVRIKEIAEKYSLPCCDAVCSREISTPFICGFFSPMLVLPENEVDEKVILHELLHLKHKDVLWGIVIAVFRSIHWCNPLLWGVFNKVNNDIEELCDSRVLSLLEGEARRNYGNILLSMVNEKYASLPGTSSAANGGKNISSRIKTIARFKQYPASSTVINVCITLVLAVLLLTGNFAFTISADAKGNYSDIENDYLFAAARTVRCHTPASAIDTYAKAVLQNNGYYRACCSAVSEHKAIAEEMQSNKENNVTPLWDSGLEYSPYNGNSYSVHNLRANDDESYCAIIAFNVYPTENIENKDFLAYQKIRISKEDGRWIVTPLADFETVFAEEFCLWNIRFELPSFSYSGENDEFFAERVIQNVVTISGNTKGDTDKPFFYATFCYINYLEKERIVYKGENAESILMFEYGFNNLYDDFDSSYSTGHGTGSGEDFAGNGEKLTGGGGFGESYNKDTLTLPDSVLFEISVNKGPFGEIMLYEGDDIYA